MFHTHAKINRSLGSRGSLCVSRVDTSRDPSRAKRRRCEVATNYPPLVHTCGCLWISSRPRRWPLSQKRKRGGSSSSAAFEIDPPVRKKKNVAVLGLVLLSDVCMRGTGLREGFLRARRPTVLGKGDHSIAIVTRRTTAGVSACEYPFAMEVSTSPLTPRHPVRVTSFRLQTEVLCPVVVLGLGLFPLSVTPERASGNRRCSGIACAFFRSRDFRLQERNASSTLFEPEHRTGALSCQ